MVTLKYLSNIWRALEMPLINCDINLDLNWSGKCVIVDSNLANQSPTFLISDAKLPVIIFSTQDNAKPLEKLKSTFI